MFDNTLRGRVRSRSLAFSSTPSISVSVSLPNSLLSQVPCDPSGPASVLRGHRLHRTRSQELTIVIALEAERDGEGQSGIRSRRSARSCPEGCREPPHCFRDAPAPSTPLGRRATWRFASTFEHRLPSFGQADIEHGPRCNQRLRALLMLNARRLQFDLEFP